MWALFFSYIKLLKFTNMSAQNFYEQMRKAGFTEDITSNDSPNYNLSFYQSIFRLMENFSKKELEEKLRWIPIEEKLPENGDEIELQNNDWINEYNPKGVRSGYYDKCKKPVFYSCYWNIDEECYDTSIQPPTHWRSFL